MSANWSQALADFAGGEPGRSWRSLDELVGQPAFRAAIADEFPALAQLDLTRRDLIRAFGASLALAGLAGCEANPDDRARPYVVDPPDAVPGRARQYATAVSFAGIAQPVLGVTNDGRPTKLEGNPDHPASRGSTDAFTQAALLDLYDPERSQVPRSGGHPISWSELDVAVAGRVATLDATGGAGFRLLTGAITSPTMQRQIAALLERWPAARWHVFEPIDDAGLHAATYAAFGRAYDVTPLLDRAQVVVALDADPLGPGPRQVINSLAWSARRRAFQSGQVRAMLLVAEPSPTLTGGRSLDRLVAPASRIPALVAALAQKFGLAGSASPLAATERRWVERAAKALAAARGHGLVLVGDGQPPEVQALAWAIDERLGNLGATSRFDAPLRPTPGPEHTIDALVADIAKGQVRTLAILETNPIYASPLSSRLSTLMPKVEFTLHAGLWFDETGSACQWHAPLAHELESWSDGRAADGSAVIMQPLVRPFYDARSPHALLAAMAGSPGMSDHDLVQQTWTASWGRLQPNWDAALVKGIAAEGARAPVSTPQVGLAAWTPKPVASGLELIVRPDPTVWDGRLANNPWAQENPKPVTTLTWDNAVLVSPALAAARGLTGGDEVRLAAGNVSVVGAAWVMPGQAPDTIVIHRGYGRRFGEVAQGAGFDATPLIGHERVTLTATGGHRALAAAQEHHAIDGTDLVRVVDYLDTAPPAPEPEEPSFWRDKPPTRPNWGMSIDLDLCTGCGACVTACNAENNIPMVGREEVRNGRRMHWLRVDRYYEGNPAAPTIHVEPVPCMHCEDAPCEMGCPVNATVHSPEGLNVQVYNRCIGTRTCSSFCPYKVRRFNWSDYTGGAAESVKAQRNPEVTVRARGVMEKCTYCIQRISAARIDAKIAGRPIADGAVKTACQQVCPTGAISFGDIADPAAQVTARKASPRDYTLLEEANTRPRTSYRARIRSERGDG